MKTNKANKGSIASKVKNSAGKGKGKGAKAASTEASTETATLETVSAGTATQVKGGAVETLSALTLDAGETSVTVKRHDLKGKKSKCMVIKELLCSARKMHIKDIAREVREMHTGDEKSLLSTIRTLRADMIRAGFSVTATVDKQMTRDYKAPTSAVLKLRGHDIGASKHTTGVQRFAVASKPTEVKAEVPSTGEGQASTERAVVDVAYDASKDESLTGAEA